MTAKELAAARFQCDKLHCTLSVKICIARQLESAKHLRRPEPGAKKTCGTREAIVPLHPHCLTERCEQGRAYMQEAVGEVIGAYRVGTRSDLDAQHEARLRAEAVTPPEREDEG